VTSLPTDLVSPQNMVEAALASSDRVRKAAESVIHSARETSAAANHVMVHRQLIGELREAISEHYAPYVTPCAMCADGIAREHGYHEVDGEQIECPALDVGDKS
jgi:hypothetical protein